MADKYQGEMTRTIKNAGFFTIKLPDAYWNGKKMVYPDVGRPDNFFAGHYTGGFIEAKTGRGKYQQRWPFSEWRDSQREWYETIAKPQNVMYFFFIVVGAGITAKQYPRIAAIIPARHIKLIEDDSDRKSLSYKDIVDMTDCRLEWLGNQTWHIPEHHIFWSEIRKVHNENS